LEEEEEFTPVPWYSLETVFVFYVCVRERERERERETAATAKDLLYDLLDCS
jgi:hypothetical protein